VKQAWIVTKLEPGDRWEVFRSRRRAEKYAERHGGHVEPCELRATSFDATAYPDAASFSGSGVYVLLDPAVGTAYVGESVNVAGRITGHCFHWPIRWLLDEVIDDKSARLFFEAK